MKNRIINLIITLVVSLIYFYVALPAINLSSPSFYAFLIFIFLVYGMLSLSSRMFNFREYYRNGFKFNCLILIPVIILIIVVVNFFSSPIFNSKSYAKLITVDEGGSFSEDIKEVDFSKVPLLDKDSSEKLGDRVMGEMSDLVSQYYVSDLYTQINYKSDILRVTPLEYADIIKYIANRKEGIKGYITVNSVNGEANLVRLDEGMRYVPSAILNEDMIRHLRFHYPTKIFGKYSFEIDEEGNPYFVIPIIKYSAVGLKREVEGIIVLDPVSGDTESYNVGDVPDWIDHVYEADMIIEQTNYWGQYKGGYWNSVFSQKNVTNTTDGYNYLAMDNDIYLYTGITSIQNDESNLGFILSNLRTKKTVFYSAPGAEEYSAMASAEGQVQEMHYNSTFPLLINLNNRPTYMVSLKDDAGLVKKYAFIDVQDYQKVTVSDSSLGIEKAAAAYLNAYNLVSEEAPITKEIKIKTIKTAIIDGNTVYYLCDEDDNRYSANITIARDILPFLSVKDSVIVDYIEGDINIIKDIKLSN